MTAASPLSRRTAFNTEADAFDALDPPQQVGAILEQVDGRIEVPEVYRLGFGLGQRGGVRPA